jgi:hypothetical protein
MWKLGRLFVENQEIDRTVKARAAGPARTILGAGLAFSINGTPWPRHIDIVGWPDEKHAQKQISIDIANGFALEMAQ